MQEATPAGQEPKKPWQTFWGGLGCGCLAVMLVLVAFPLILQWQYSRGAAGQRQVRLRRAAERMRGELIEAGQALKRYRDEKGRYPGRLDDLAAGYLSQEKLKSLDQAKCIYQAPPQNAGELFPVISCGLDKDTGLELRSNGSVGVSVLMPAPKGGKQP